MMENQAKTTDISVKEFQIFGDNILECERALELLTQALGGVSAEITWSDGPLFMPVYNAVLDSKIIIKAQLFPGYKRWNFDVANFMRNRGAKLREATDAVIFEKRQQTDGQSYFQPVLSFEFCGALPAGNNAWQRAGRALASAQAHIPYLYFAELGGSELDANRKKKSSRFPNPIIPYSYLSLAKTTGTISVPVFLPSPSITNDTYQEFSESFAKSELLDLIKSILTNSEQSSFLEPLRLKTLKTISLLSQKRKRNDSLQQEEWEELMRLTSGAEKSEWFTKRKMKWNKKVTLKDKTKTLKDLIKATVQSGAVAIGSESLPFCLLPASQRPILLENLKRIYQEKISVDFENWLQNNEKPLVIIWLAGFKPRGDDSRPDRGLVPLTHMLFGENDVDYLSIVYGPAKKNTWDNFSEKIPRLAETNGLWESIINLSNAILIDSKTAKELKPITFLCNSTSSAEKTNNQVFNSIQSTRFGEHDVDTILHTLLSSTKEGEVFESMCNPPGGDWSGISLQDGTAQKILRWTSLPRVSGVDMKRPDHVVIFHDPISAVIAIESKDHAKDLETNIGPRLIKYVQKILEVPPNIMRESIKHEWQNYDGEIIQLKHNIHSVAAFQYTNAQDFSEAIKRNKVDMTIAVEFLENQKVLLHLTGNDSTNAIRTKIIELSQRFGGWLEIHVD